MLQYPNLPVGFVVGAMKAGTTTVHEWLKADGFALPEKKETHYFSDEEKFSHGIEWYGNQFVMGANIGIRIEVDPEYLHSSGAVRRIAETYSGVPKPKFVCIVRDPLERAYSHWKMDVRNGYENRTFKNAMEACRQNGPEYLREYFWAGMYADMLKQYSSEFGPKSTLVLPFEDLFDKATVSSAYGRILHHFGQELKGEIPDPSKGYNQARESRFPPLMRLINVDNPIRRLVGRIIPSDNLKFSIIKSLRRLNTRSIPNISDTADIDDVTEMTIETYREMAGRLITQYPDLESRILNWKIFSDNN